MIVAADATNAARNEVGVSGILSLHEDAVTPKDRRSAVTLGDTACPEVDLREDSEATNYPRNRIPIHLYQIAGLSGDLFIFSSERSHPWLLYLSSVNRIFGCIRL
jgi:hypothetical protein